MANDPAQHLTLALLRTLKSGLGIINLTYAEPQKYTKEETRDVVVAMLTCIELFESSTGVEL